MEGERRVIGFTSYTVTLIPGFGQTLYGQDVCVHPGHRGQGIARELHAARLSIGRDIGAHIFMGTVHPDNKTMVRIMEESGMHRCLPVEDSFLYVGQIVEV
jgi:RimJ/RimL family protein N-acetyltransferase